MPLYRTVCKNPSAALSEIRSSACLLPDCILAFLACTVSSSALTLGKIASTHSGGTGTCNMSHVFAFSHETAGRHKCTGKLINTKVAKIGLKICLTFCMLFLHFLFAQMYMYNCAHQGSAKEVTPHEGGLLPTTGNSKGLQCCQGVLLYVSLAQTTFCPVTCTAGIADIQCMSNCRSLSYTPSHRECTQWCLVLMLGYIQSCMLTPDLEQLHPSTTTGQQDDTTVPAVLSGDSLLTYFLPASSQANLLLLLLPE